MSDPVADFIAANLQADIHQLLLSAQKYPGIPMPYAVAQIEALRKVKDKIPAWYSPQLQFPAQISIEQSSSELTAKFKSSLFSGQRLADLTGGLGIDSFFWARSFDEVDYVEQQPALCATALHNFKTLGRTNIAIHPSSAEAFLAEKGHQYDLIYLDPARRDQRNQKIFHLSDCQPDVVALRAALLARSPKVLIKAAPMLDIALAIKQLEQVTTVWVVAVDNECKEVLYLLERTAENRPEQVRIHAINLPGGQAFSFTKQEEDTAFLRFSEPLQYLYEPHTAILKAGAFRYFGQTFGLAKLHPNTQLYTADTLVPEVPARQFMIRAILKYDAKTVKSVLPVAKANIAVRNFPDTAEQVRKKLQLADGGDWYLFAVTVSDGSKKIIVCEKA